MMMLRRQTISSTSRVRFSYMRSCATATGASAAIRLLSMIIVSACVAVLAVPMPARADWPERPVKLIVTFPAGSANDAAARIFAGALGKRWGKPVIVEDKPGAEGTIGVGSFVANQDDHTLLYTVAGSVTVAPLLIDKLPYDVDRDLEPIAATTAIIATIEISDAITTSRLPKKRPNIWPYPWTERFTKPKGSRLNSGQVS